MNVTAVSQAVTIVKHDPQQLIERHFRAGRTLTVVEAQQFYHTTELRRIVSRLRRKGMNIKPHPVTGELYCRYWMEV